MAIFCVNVEGREMSPGGGHKVRKESTCVGSGPWEAFLRHL